MDIPEVSCWSSPLLMCPSSNHSSLNPSEKSFYFHICKLRETIVNYSLILHSIDMIPAIIHIYWELERVTNPANTSQATQKAVNSSKSSFFFPTRVKGPLDVRPIYLWLQINHIPQNRILLYFNLMIMVNHNDCDCDEILHEYWCTNTPNSVLDKSGDIDFEDELIELSSIFIGLVMEQVVLYGRTLYKRILYHTLLLWGRCRFLNYSMVI